MAFPENQVQGKSSEAAESGTASHTLSAVCLLNGKNAEDYLGTTVAVRDDDGNIISRYEVDDERAERVQAYVDDVRRDALGGILWVEHHVDLSRYVGDDQGGTSDAVIIQPRKKLLKVKDLKDGQRRVYASYEHTDGTRRINHQMGQYALGALDDAMLAGYEIDTVEVEVQQPRLGWVDRFEISAEDLIREFGVRLRSAIAKSNMAMVMPIKDLDAKGMLTPGPKQCEWCRAVARCPAYLRQVAKETRMDFDDETSEPVVPTGTKELAAAYKAVPMVKAWVRAVESGVWNGVLSGTDIIGPDGQPYKIVQGPDGRRAWKPEDLLSGDVEAALAGQLGPDAYETPKPITAPEAEKRLTKKFKGKKKAEPVWQTFAHMIQKAKGAAQLVLGSDPRPKFGEASAVAADFDDEIGVEE